MNKLALVVICVSAIACGGKKKGGGDAKPLDVAGVNALVPASLKDKVTFEKTEIKEERGRHSKTYTVAAPKGWKQEMKGFASLKPDKDMGFMTSFKVGTNCDGECVSKDWAATVEKVYGSYLKGTVIKDQKSATGRTIIASSGDTTIVVIASWKDGAREYSHCGATLDNQLKDAAPAFEKACESIRISED